MRTDPLVGDDVAAVHVDNENRVAVDLNFERLALPDVVERRDLPPDERRAVIRWHT